MSQAGGFGTGGSPPVTFPITVPEGGTGLTTVVQGDLLYAPSLNTLASLPKPAIPGSILTYNGSVPSWGSLSTSMFMQDDFISGTTMGILGWVNVAGGGGSVDPGAQLSTPSHPGVWLLRVDGSFASASVQQNTAITFGGGAMTIEWIAKNVQLSTSTNRFNIQIGTGDVFNGSPTQNGVYFFYQDNVNSGNWQLMAVNGCTATTTNSPPHGDTNFHRFTIEVNASGSSAEFFIDGVSQGTVTSNIPTTNLTSFQIQINNTGPSTSTNCDLWLDAFSAYQLFTTSR